MKHRLEHIFQVGWFNHQLPGEPKTFILGGYDIYDPYIEGLKPSIFPWVVGVQRYGIFTYMNVVDFLWFSM